MAIEIIEDRYEVEQRLGSGGMGDVWLATDTLLGRKVAIKFVSARELATTPGARAILMDEAKAAGRLFGFPQIVGVLNLLVDVKTDLHEGPALIMEFVDGCNLADWIAIHAPDLDDETRLLTGLYITLEVVEAVQLAHKRGVLHRDVKPLNILLSRTGSIKVADFGLARLVEAITRTHTVWGRQTPLYAAPEQWQDEKPNDETDVYQLCATAYHLLAGEPANTGTNLLGVVNWHARNKPEPLQAKVNGISPQVAQLIDAGLSSKRADRPSLWPLFDAISTSLMSSLRLKLSASNPTPDILQELADLTDFGIPEAGNAIKKSVVFPNPMEALREAIGIKLIGASPTLSRVDQA